MEITNRKARYDYEIEDTYEAGIVLKGTEIKSIRNGKAQLKDSYAILKNGEVFLLNMHISAYEKGNIFNHEETRTRKLLLHKKEILKIGKKGLEYEILFTNHERKYVTIESGWSVFDIINRFDF